MHTQVKTSILLAAFATLHGVQSTPNPLLDRRDITCSTPGSNTGTHCAIFNDDDGYSNVPFSPYGLYQCVDYNAQGQGLTKCQYQDGNSVVLSCDTVDGSQLQVYWGADGSHVESITGNYIKWYWESETYNGIPPNGQGSRETCYSDDNIYITCTGSKY